MLDISVCHQVFFTLTKVSKVIEPQLSYNIMYATAYTKCRITYSGEASLILGSHIQKHLYDISQNAFNPISNHFSSLHHIGKSHFLVTAH